MTKRKSKPLPKASTPSASTPRKGLKNKQRKVQEHESPTSENYPEGLKQKKLVFATANTPPSLTDTTSDPPPDISANSTAVASIVSPTEVDPGNSDLNGKAVSAPSYSECRYKITLVI